MTELALTHKSKDELWGHPKGLYILFFTECGNGFPITECVPFWYYILFPPHNKSIRGSVGTTSEPSLFTVGTPCSFMLRLSPADG